MPKRSDGLLVNDIIINIEAILRFVDNDTYEEFADNDMKSYAVVRAFEIIGGAATVVSEELKAKYPDIEWREMKAFRNRLIHEYFGIDMEFVWQIIKYDLPKNYPLLKAISFE